MISIGGGRCRGRGAALDAGMSGRVMVDLETSVRLVSRVEKLDLQLGIGIRSAHSHATGEATYSMTLGS